MNTIVYQNGKQKLDAGLSDYVFGKVPPQAIQLEEAVLGAIMIDHDALSIVLDILKPESFYKSEHKAIFAAMLRLFEKSQPIDLLTVTESLRQSGEIDMVGGPYYIIELTSRVASSANIEFHARIVQQKFIARELIRVSGNVIREAFDETTDPLDLVDNAERNVFAVTQAGFTRQSKSVSALTLEVLKDLEAIGKSGIGLTGIPSGFTSLDRLTSGWQQSDLIIVAARPGMGKTSFVMNVARNAAADYQKPVAIFSLEMSSKQLTAKMISCEAKISSTALRAAKLTDGEWQKIHRACEVISEMPVHIDDTPGMSISELRAKCRRLKMQHDIQLVIVDYLQLMTAGDRAGNRDQQIGEISRGLKAVAKELNVPVIALSQLSRAVETRGGTKRPMLSDLRESGNIEQDADIVSFIYRPEYYQILEDENGQSVKGLAEFIIAKHRNGALETVKLRFTDKYAAFSDWEDVSFNYQPETINYTEPKTLQTGSAMTPPPDDQDIPF